MSELESSLSELQLELMRVIWQRKRATVAEVTEALSARRELAHTTVATLLTRLEKRGLLAADRDGRQLVYRPLVAEQAVRRSMVSSLVDSLFGGRPQELLAHLLREEEIARDDLEAIADLLGEPAEAPEGSEGQPAEPKP